MNQENRFDGAGLLARTGCAPYIIILAVLASCSKRPLTLQEAEVVAQQHVNHGNDASYTTVTRGIDETQTAYYFNVSLAERQTVAPQKTPVYHLVRVDKQSNKVESGQLARDKYAIEKPSGPLLTPPLF